MDPIFYLPIIIFVAAGIILVIVAMNNIKKANRLATKRYHTVPAQHKNEHRYIPGQFSSQMEFDMRLPYSRFKQLYPDTRWTYEEYKRMQMQTAFRRSYSSQDNKRMVR